MADTLTVEQQGAAFTLEWTLAVAEDVALWRTEPDEPDVQIATLDSTVTSFVDVRDDLDPGDTVEWKIVGATAGTLIVSTTAAAAYIPPLDSERRKLAALILAARLWKRRDSPLGLLGGGEFGAVRLGFKDPDVELLLVGLRRSVSDLASQTWPTVAEVRAHGKIATAVTDAEITIPLTAAIEIVKDRCRTSAGVGIA